LATPQPSIAAALTFSPHPESEISGSLEAHPDGVTLSSYPELVSLEIPSLAALFKQIL
jgi:hypothetical protein